MIAVQAADLVREFEALTLDELAEFGRLFEARFGVSAAVPVVPTVPVESQEPEVQATFDVVLVAAGESRVKVIKVVREVVAGLGLKEAKDLVESAPHTIADKLGRASADALAQRLRDAGAEVDVH